MFLHWQFFLLFVKENETKFSMSDKSLDKRETFFEQSHVLAAHPILYKKKPSK